jgi:predicted aspartyl protease
VPILSLQLSAERKLPDGRIEQGPPSLALLQRGPVVQVTVTVEEHVAKSLLQQGKTIPTPISGLALIDSGASVTCIDQDAANILQIPVIDVVSVNSASHEATWQNVYPIQIEVTGVNIRLQAPRAIGAPLKCQGLLLLLGRDVLQFCTLFYNGTTGTFSLAI